MKIVRFILGFFSNEWKENKRIYKTWWEGIKRKRAIKMANLQHKADGRMYYVIRIGRNFVVCNNDDIKKLKKARVLKKTVNVHDLLKYSVYTTHGKEN